MNIENAKPFTAPPVESVLQIPELLPANQLRRYPSNRAVPREHVEAMADSIRQIGVLQPITVRPLRVPETHLHGPTEYYEIVVGESRWRGCLELDQEYPVPCFVRELSDKEAARIHAVENFQRKDLDIIEEAQELKHLQEAGWSVDEILVFIGCKKDHFYKRLTLLSLGDEAKQALRDGNISLGTAVKLASVPEDKRDEALAAVTQPTTSTRPLSERQAMDLLDEEFIDPAKFAREWDRRRDAIEQNYPGAKWQSYDEARMTATYAAGYVAADTEPHRWLLSPAAKEGLLRVPTWAELAEKHGAPLVIGCDSNGEAGVYVEWDPLVDAEKTACSDNPGECVFVHEAAVFAENAAAEARRREQAERMEARWEEQLRIAAAIVEETMGKTAGKNLLKSACSVLVDDYRGLCFSDLNGYYGVDDCEELQDRVSKYMGSKSRSPFESFGRLCLAAMTIGRPARELAQLVFESGAVKSEEFPLLHEEYEKWQAHQEEMAAKAAAAAQAEGERVDLLVDEEEEA